MRRREVITLLGGAAVTWPLAARAQQPAKVPRVGILSPAASETAATLTAFREGIRDLGYIEGQTIALDFRLSKGIMDALPALATELVRNPVNVIVTDTTSATLAAFAATHTIPIVVGAAGGDPIALGLAKSLSRPGGNDRQAVHVASDIRPVDLVVTELAVIGFPEGRATLLETAPGVSPDQVAAATQAELVIPKSVPEMAL
jgi:putative ABC transport system substrate-binding protein